LFSTIEADAHKCLSSSIFQYIKENFVEIEEELLSFFDYCHSINIRSECIKPGIINFKFGKTNAYKKIPIDYRKLKDFIKSFPFLEGQGNGIKSILSIVLSIMIFKDKIILIDKPEEFLNPNLVSALGNWISHYSIHNSNQIIFATNDSNFVTGISNNATTVDINIERIEKKVSGFQFDSISPTVVNEISKIPLLSDLPIVESIFYKGVILCEGESDRIFYKSILDNLMYKTDILFINTSGKHTMKNIIPFVKELKTPFKLIADFDLLLSEKEFDNIIVKMTTEKKSQKIICKRKKFSRAIQEYNKVEDALNKQIFHKLNIMLNKKIEHDDESLIKIKKSVENFSERSKIERIKRNGIQAMDKENKLLVKQLIDESKKIGLYIVPYGALESWVKKDIDKKKWIGYALSNVNNNISFTLNNFIMDIYTSFQINELYN
jgi:hypothetical protein